MKLTPELAIELGKVRADVKEGQKRDKEVSDFVKKEMADRKLKQYDPKESPYMLCRDEGERSQVPWKDEWINLAKEKYGKKWKKVMANIQDDCREPTVSLRVEPNPKYQGGSR